ncbi:transglutaminase-like domain-containing protein [Ilumatobacter nonamiensis]|uniref:transglutaminase-like domain-containing protein n=1 Tax=Ilumatobacter nonamiensis TaxID=467093 RepID=UPI00034CA58C|nr:transglutaminase family protein [Ilumatobacter nonamiensis]
MIDGIHPVSNHRRLVTAHLELFVAEESDIVLAIAAAGEHVRHDEELLSSVDGFPINATLHGHLCFLENVPPGLLLVDYRATVLDDAPPVAATVHDRFQYIRPSRYCESDRLGPLARAEFGGLTGADLLAGVSSWVGLNIAYVAGSSRPIDGAVATLLGREGVCRDFAHLTAALLRANNVAARVVSVYAPGLMPMDFHVVTEACLDGHWYVVDPTRLAPRGSMVRIATGLDASDIAFLTTLRGVVELNFMSVSATTDADLPTDDLRQLARLR